MLLCVLWFDWVALFVFREYLSNIMIYSKNAHSMHFKRASVSVNGRCSVQKMHILSDFQTELSLLCIVPPATAITSLGFTA